VKIRALLLLVMLWPSLVMAGGILDSGVRRAGNGYALFVDADIQAPPDQVYRAITDYENLAVINPSIVSSVLLGRSDGIDRVRTRIQVCILVFCKHVIQVQDLRYPDRNTIEATMVPGAGDFQSGQARWTLGATETGTRLHFAETFVPAFWVPPVIGPWLIQHKLVEEVEVTMRHIEQQQDRPPS
jgi:Polyketide cyclase / dehydrase and lipid transport